MFIVCCIIFSYSGLVLFVSISCHLPSDHMELSCYIFAAYFINDTHCYALFLVETIFFKYVYGNSEFIFYHHLSAQVL